MVEEWLKKITDSFTIFLVQEKKKKKITEKIDNSLFCTRNLTEYGRSYARYHKYLELDFHHGFPKLNKEE